jgi:arsenite methyltransferase
MENQDNQTVSERIKEEVRSYYSAVADASTGTCCGESSASSCCGSPFYSGDALATIPLEASSSSRGCGNPGTIAAMAPGEVVLDLGSGGGLDVLLAARQVGPDGFVYGVDMTDRMLELARRNAAQAGVTNVAFLKGDIESIPLPDASVDVIISNCVLNLAPDKGQVLAEAFRVLRPGGRLAVSDIVIDGDLDDLPVSEAQIRAGLSWAGCIAGALTVEQYRAFLTAAGFEAIQIVVEHRSSRADFPGDLPTTLAGLAPDTLADLIQRFTSSAITARRPAD